MDAEPSVSETSQALPGLAFDDLKAAYTSTLALFEISYPNLVAALRAKGMTIDEFFFGMAFMEGTGVRPRFLRDRAGTTELTPCSCEGCDCTSTIECAANNCPCCDH